MELLCIIIIIIFSNFIFCFSSHLAVVCCAFYLIFFSFDLLSELFSVWLPREWRKVEMKNSNLFILGVKQVTSLTRLSHFPMLFVKKFAFFQLDWVPKRKIQSS